jgi:hypothetical protein
MSLLDELACKEHREVGFTSGCYPCELSVYVATLRQALTPLFQARADTTGMVMPTVLLVQAPPTIARKAYYALGKAVSGAELNPGERDLLQTIRDMMQDCVEKLR